jgi:ceramide glucosyltransferase
MTWWMWGMGGSIWLAYAAQAVLAAMLVRKFARCQQRPTRHAHQTYRPRVAVVVPFKGLDLDMMTHLRGLLTQDYPDYRLIAVVENDSDPAHAVLTEAMRSHPDRLEIVTAGAAGDRQGQKVHNLLAGWARVRSLEPAVEAVAFADSDVGAAPHWLANLIGPLLFEFNGVTTGYRWMIPADARLSSRLASVLNASVACWAGREQFNHAWGGSMAMRVAFAEEAGLVERWRGALSDDYQVSRMCREAGKRIYFRHDCLVATPTAFTWRGLFEFGRRQYVITRTHAPWLYLGALGLTSLHVLGLAWTVGSLAWLLATQAGRLIWLVPLASLVTASIAHRQRASFRERVIRLAFGEATVERLRGTLKVERYATPFYMTVHWLVVLSAMCGRTITWRGNRYRIRGPQDIEKLP